MNTATNPFFFPFFLAAGLTHTHTQCVCVCAYYVYVLAIDTQTRSCEHVRYACCYMNRHVNPIADLGKCSWGRWRDYYNF